MKSFYLNYDFYDINKKDKIFFVIDVKFLKEGCVRFDVRFCEL